MWSAEDMVDAQRSIVSIDQVDKSLQDKVRQFIDLVAAADSNNQVWWQVGNYHALLQNMARIAAKYEKGGRHPADPTPRLADAVWAFGRWTDLKTVREEEKC